MKAPILSDDQFATVFRHAEDMNRPKMYRLMLLLSVKLGLRPMELAGLDSSWFRPNELRIPIGHSKRKSGRSIPINEEILVALREHIGSREGRVFLNHSGNAFSPRGISEAMTRLYDLAGIAEGSCYSGRRTLATNMVDRGINIAVVSKVLGHSSIATTQNYIGVTDRMMANALFG
ncbi:MULTISPECIES: site-specific integrase [unclassified Sphingopyxis]|uniref:tyrosine-type recombinase/integrase n=1 Tax=unclassified Sphingopyxis TaxID=2614943 RepID=UPI0009E89077|nr:MULTISPECIES: site-specific integrase [unclassified Sphingopyxis]